MNDTSGPAVPLQRDGGTGPADGQEPGAWAQLSRPVQLAVTGAVALCVSAAVVHVALVFLYVAPANTVSRQYQSQIDAWIYPYFEQDWRLFAPDPQSTHQQISARTSTVAANGVTQTSDWIDLTAVDDAAVRHDVFPSHTAQNMLRRAWDAYETALGTDARLTSRRTLMLQEYLRNIAVQRAATRVHEPFDAIQLRVVTTPIEQPSVRPVSNRPAASAPGVRYLPWWQVTTDDL
ncbi:hypothetical protein GCM10009838_56460 [Catenulispora subtropica]|uniref:Integral membrane protein n=1 Tax=Catenulispora subtropica TaxID=450798 RepID=A0ABN2SH93_9ACTN